MTTRVEITHNAEETTVHVTDDTGRDETRTVPNYPHPDTATYVKFVDALDRFMAGG
jgi:hypothetical protein